ncbi:hypothetical protein [Tepidimonas alkaliphilus]|uniref:hypothetical protein n=1 Tax=Tepidimonas alkaliphilus TaxID=2588942 RepID=UPI001FE6C4AF|nr:hypothetical protein [Tepidimonas alkaliphilus]
MQQALVAARESQGWRERQQACRQRTQERYSLEAMVRRYRAVWEETLARGRAK